MLSPREIYQVVTKSGSGIEGYQLPAFYHDPAEISRNRDLIKQIEQGKTHKRYETKRGSYLNDYVKQFKSMPSPSEYQSIKEIKSQERKIKYPKKKSLFDDIINKAKKNKQPGVGRYNVEKTLEEIAKTNKELSKKKIYVEDRHSIMENDAVQQFDTPGPGNYNPHPILPKIKLNHMKPKDWIQKHSQKKKGSSVVSLPPVGTYSPIVNDSFAKISASPVSKRAYWGSEKRFQGLWRQIISPGPATYAQLQLQMSKLSNPISKSVYQI